MLLLYGKLLLSLAGLAVLSMPTASRAAEDAAAGGASSAAFKPYTGEAKEIKLPGKVADAVPAGGGRYLLLHLKTLRKIAVYDVNEAAVARYLPVTTDDAVMAAGAEELIVVNTVQNVIERWSLSTWERETVRPLPFSGVFKTMALGYASGGPLLMHWAKGSDALDRAVYTFVDLETLEAVPGLESVRGNNTSYRDYVHIRAAATGRVFGLWATSHSPQGLETILLRGKKAENLYEHDSAGHVCPNVDGSMVLTGDGVYTARLQKKSDDSTRNSAYPCLPTTHPDLFLAVTAEPGRQQNLGIGQPADARAELYRLSTGKKIAGFSLGRLGAGEGTSWARHDFTIDKRIHYIVQADQVVVIPFSNDRLLVRPLKLTDALRETGSDYVLVTSLPPHSFHRGGQLQYRLQVETNLGDVSFELSAAPAGMTLSKDGQLRWQVPADFEDDTAVVIITLTAGKETEFHAFRMQME